MIARISNRKLCVALLLALFAIVSCGSTEKAGGSGPSGSGGSTSSVGSTTDMGTGPGTGTGTGTGVGGNSGGGGGGTGGDAGGFPGTDAGLDAGCSSCSAGTTLLQNGWTLQASNAVSGATGKQISTPGFATPGWYPVSVPTTVLAGLVANHVYPDPYVADNMTKIPASIAATSWWYRLEFTPSADFNGQSAWL